MKSVEERYMTDPLFHALVDSLYSYIDKLELSPSEIREAAMFACIKHEQDNVRSIMYFPKPMKFY